MSWVETIRREADLFAVVTHATSGRRVWPSILAMMVPCAASRTKTCPPSSDTASQGFPGAIAAEYTIAGLMLDCRAADHLVFPSLETALTATVSPGV